MMIENSQMQRQTGAAVESFRNEVVKANEEAQHKAFFTLNYPHNVIEAK